MRKTAFNTDWKFASGDSNSKPITLPHDAMLEQGRKADAPSKNSGAFFMGGVYTYEKTFFAPEEWVTQEAFIEFEGIYPMADVYLNEVRLGTCTNGYLGFRFSLNNLSYGQNNTLRVVVDHSQLPDSRWYSGSGIYRPAWLWVAAKEHIQPDGIRVKTLSIDPAQIQIEVEHCAAEDTSVEVDIIYQGASIAQGQGKSITLSIPDAKLWDAENPHLYGCIVTLKRGDEVLDSQQSLFGIRKLEWSKDGFFVNEKRVLLKGGCIHHDNGILGAKSYKESEYRRVKRLKEFGFNAIRSSHNPACISMLEACDALGMYVMDEGWDMWYKHKTPHDYATYFEAQHQQDIKSIVERDYNHPSVIMYSVGNEVTEPHEEKGVTIGKELVRLFHAADDTRPVTAGINLTLLMMASMGIDLTQQSAEGESASEKYVPQKDVSSTDFNEMVSGMGAKMTMAAATDEADQLSSPILDALDIAGYNYASSRYEIEGEKHPGRIVVGSETYPYELANNWRMVEKYPYLIGDFMWTAWDYMGEVGIGAWTWEKDVKGFEKPYPWLLADAGALDILGNDNAEAGLAAVVWGARTTPYIGVVPVNHPGQIPMKAIWRGSNALPYWSYQGCDGNKAEVEVYTTGHEVELFLNGRSIGKSQVEECKTTFITSYEPGEISAVAYTENGEKIGESSLKSADGATRIRIQPEEEAVHKGDILYLKIDLVGSNGQIECNKDTCLKVEVEGGELLGFGSANPRSEESFLSGSYTTYYGRSQAVIRCNDKRVTVRVSGDGLETITHILTTNG